MPTPLFPVNDVMSKYNTLQKKLDSKIWQEKQYQNPDDYETIFDEPVSIDQKDLNQVIFIYLPKLMKL